ncbi:hypothetical protein B0H63DRAFT_521760 [Podospora didyma]|uniref:Hydrophobin n=1 Tax=Podospora didyma TaxID=330526 RepID=A0AAE0NUF8_9PEZI|nr:hypothetical protein B0H63DRAFT_521760 [Podospora didyma]
MQLSSIIPILTAAMAVHALPSVLEVRTGGECTDTSTTKSCCTTGSALAAIGIPILPINLGATVCAVDILAVTLCNVLNGEQKCCKPSANNEQTGLINVGGIYVQCTNL